MKYKIGIDNCLLDCMATALKSEMIRSTPHTQTQTHTHTNKFISYIIIIIPINKYVTKSLMKVGTPF